MRSIIFLVFLVSSAVYGHATGAPKRSFTDNEIIRFLTGTIINPPDSADYDPRPTNQIFYKNGSYKYFIYHDKGCKKIKEERGARWQVKDGILISILDDGVILKDEILEITGDRMKLLSLDDGQTFIRRKADGC